MHPLVTMKKLEEDRAEARRIQQEYEQKQRDNERAADEAAGYAD